MSDAAVFTPPEGTPLELPIRAATEGSPGANISKLLSSTGLVTYDPGFANTASCTSAITYIDGDAGILRYRGYPIDELATGSTFLETSYLLIYGELPTQAELNEFAPGFLVPGQPALDHVAYPRHDAGGFEHASDAVLQRALLVIETKIH